MDYDQNDIEQLYKSIGLKEFKYIEVKENEEILEIINKWPLVKEIITNNTNVTNT